MTSEVELKIVPPVPTGEKVGSLQDPNFPKDADGRVYHLGLKKGEICNRILSVGDPVRAFNLSGCLDDPTKTFVRMSNRGFTVYTGLRKGVPVSIVSIGMGTSMMDFLIREARAIIDGPMVVIRFGTCGAINPSVKLGSITVATKGAVMLRQNVDAFFSEPNVPRYSFSKPVFPDPKLTQLLKETIQEAFQDSPETFPVVDSLNCTTDSFYSSQGRTDSNFADDNTDLLEQIKSLSVDTLEMETFQLFYLGKCCRLPLITSAVALAIAQRCTNDFLDNMTIKRLEVVVGSACLDALIKYPLAVGQEMEGSGCVWFQKPSSP